jgi:hypothetical protein
MNRNAYASRGIVIGNDDADIEYAIPGSKSLQRFA